MESLSAECRNIRRLICEMNHAAAASHTGSALSIVEILAVLYFRVLRIDPAHPDDPCRDRFILSKGHASTALYATLARRGFFGEDVLRSYYQDGSSLPGHLDRNSVPGVEVSAGSLGHGLPLGTGMARELIRQKKNSRVFVVVGDGELNEGTNWEAAQLAPQLQLANLTLIVDTNSYQGMGRVESVIDLEPLCDKWKAFRWDVVRCDGHCCDELEKALGAEQDRPRVIVADTRKGRGVSFMEDTFIWHYKSPDDDQLKQALGELL